MERPSLTLLDRETQEQIDNICTSFRKRNQNGELAPLDRYISIVPEQHQLLVAQLLLNEELEAAKKKPNVKIPTLFELRTKYPTITKLLDSAYQWVDDRYQIPERIANYNIVTVLGEGSQARVLKGTPVEGEGSAVAIKLCLHKEQNGRIIAEYNLLQKIHRQAPTGILPCYSKDVHKGKSFFVMPYLKGENLLDKYQTSRPTSKEAVSIVKRIADVLAVMHAEQVLHRDISPGNIFCGVNTGPMLIDLGLAFDQDKWVNPKELLNEHHGTIAYMSPEQFDQNNDANGKLSDIYSLGAILFFLLTGNHPPIVKRKDSKRKENIEKEIQQQLKSNSLDSNPRIRSTCFKAMQYEAGHRFASAKEFSDALKACLNNLQSRKAIRKYATAAAYAFLLCALITPIAYYGINSYSKGSAGAVSTENMNNDMPTLDSSSAVPTASKPILNELSPQPELPVVSGHSNSNSNLLKTLMSEQEIKVDQLTNESFQLTFIHNPEGSYFKWLIYIDASPKYRDLLRASELRVGKRPWIGNLVDGSRNGRYFPVHQADLEAGGPVQLRLDSKEGLETGYVVGPYNYAIDINEEFRTRSKQVIDGKIPLAKKATWIEIKNGRINLSGEAYRKYYDVVKEIRLGKSQGYWDEIISFESLNPNKTRSYPGAFNWIAGNSAHNQIFLKYINQCREQGYFYHQVVFLDGSVTDEAKVYINGTADDSGKLVSTLEYFTQKKNRQTGLAKLSGARLEVAGFAEVAYDIDHLLLGPTSNSLERKINVSWESRKQFDARHRQLKPGELGDYAHYRGDKYGCINHLPFVENFSSPWIDVPAYWNEVYLKPILKGKGDCPTFRIINTHKTFGFEANRIIPIVNDMQPELHVYVQPTHSLTVVQSPIKFQSYPSKGYVDTLALKDGGFQLLNKDRDLSWIAGGKIKLVYRGFDREELGPIEFQIDTSRFRESVNSAYLDIAQSLKSKLFDVWVTRNDYVSSLKSNSSRRKPSYFIQQVVKHLEKSRSSKGTVVIAGKAGYGVWAPIKAVRIGLTKDRLSQRFPMELSSDAIFKNAKWERQKPVFVALVDTDSDYIFAAFDFFDGTSTAPFVVPLANTTSSKSGI